QTNFSKNMIEQKARMPIDHMRGMTPEQVARATLRAVERGSDEIHLTFQGKLIVFVSRFFPWIADLFARHKVHELFRDEIAARRAGHGTTPGRLTIARGG